jgi:DNA-binding CsgD family transcriptional regulator
MTTNQYTLQTLTLEYWKALPIAIFIKNRHSKYLWANDFFIKKSAGFQSIADIENKKDGDFAWQEYSGNLVANDQQVFQTNEETTAFERILRHNGTYVDIVSKKCPLLDQNQKLIGLIGFSMALPKPENAQVLSHREYSAVLLMSEGCTDKEIARKLGISPRTVEYYINNAKQKMRVTSRYELILRCCR